MLAEQFWHGLFEMPQIAIVMGCLVACTIPIAGIIASFWYKAAKVRSENALKRAMVERGFSADDIERVIDAQPEEPMTARR